MAAGRANVDMLNGPILKPFIRYSIPIMLSGILQLMFNAADVVVVGRFAGDAALAAVGSTGSLCTLFTNLFIGLSVGANVATARACGARDDRCLNRVVHTSIALGLICGAIVMTMGLLFAPQILQIMDTPEEIIGLAAVYLRIYFLGMLAMMLYNFGAAILRSIGDTRRPLIYLTTAGVVNVILNLIFVIVFKMSVAGVALATVISQCVSAALVLICLARSQGAIHLDIRRLRLNRDALGDIVRVGLPAGIQSTIFSISNVLIQSSINSFGAITVAGNSAASNIDGFVGTALGSFYQAVVSFTGQNCGAKKYDRLWRILGAAVICDLALGGVMGVGVWYFGETLLGIYSDSQAVIAAGMIRLACVALPHAIGGVMDSVVGSLRGMGRSVTPMLVSILGVCGFRLVWILTICKLPQFRDSVAMVYISYPISWTLTLIMHFVCLIFEMRRLKRGAAEA